MPRDVQPLGVVGPATPFADCGWIAVVGRDGRVMRLSKLQVAGIVLSLLWAIGAAVHSHNADVSRATNFGDLSFRVCSHSPAAIRSGDLSKCKEERQKNFQLFMEGSTGNAAFLALAPIPFFWLAAFCLLYFVRAQVAGFRAVVPWASLSKWKRVFVGFCAASSVAALIVAAVVLMNWYTDRLVPVTIGGQAMVSSAKDGSYVQVEGTWTRTDLTGDTIASPLQTSDISCTKEDNRCTEATAEVSGGALMVDQVDHTVVSWTPQSIVMRDELPCATTTYVIDLRKL